MRQPDLRLAGLVCLSAGVLVSFGELSLMAISLVAAALVLVVLSSAPQLRSVRIPHADAVLFLGLGATAILYNAHLFRGVFLPAAAGVGLCLLLLRRATTVRSRALCAIAAGAAWLAALIANVRWGFADIDVFHFQQNAALALLQGENPYTPVAAGLIVRAPGVVTTAPLHLPYGPIIPVLEAPFRLLGDVRVLHVIAAIATGVAVVLLGRRGGARDRALLVALASPLWIGMVLFAWIDVITMAGIALWMVLMRSHPRVAVVILAVALGAKPTTVVALVPILFWSVRARRQALIAACAAAVFVLPFAAITGFSQFYYNVLGVQLELPPRLDALTLNSLLHSIGLPLLPLAASAGVIAAVTVLVLRRRPSTYADVLTGTAILTIVSFLVAKWAFFNYYYIAAVLLMLAIAGDGVALDAAELIRPPVVFERTALWLRRRVRRRALTPA